MINLPLESCNSSFDNITESYNFVSKPVTRKSMSNDPCRLLSRIVLFVITISMTYLFIAVTNRITNRGKWEMV